jgi:RNA polymerase-binding transcription factor DksA
MEATTIDSSFARLIKRREQLLTTLNHLDDEQSEVERNTDWVDEAAFDSRVALLDGLRYDYQAEMTRIDRALARIDNRQYGSCAACHDPIDPKRLELVPEAEFCAGCESFREGVEQYAA